MERRAQGWPASSGTAALRVLPGGAEPARPRGSRHTLLPPLADRAAPPAAYRWAPAHHDLVLPEESAPDGADTVRVFLLGPDALARAASAPCWRASRGSWSRPRANPAPGPWRI